MEKPTLKPISIHAGMTILEVVSQFRGTEEIFKQFDQKAGVCLCCEALFERLDEVAEKYHLDVHDLIQALQNAALQETL